MGLNEAHNPMDRLDAFLGLDLKGTGLEAKKHVLLGQQATDQGRLADAAREFMAAAVGGDAEGMYNYALRLMKGRGTRKNIPEAVRWLEKAASMPIDSSPMGKLVNVGVGEAMATLGNLYDGGVHFSQNKKRAREYWEKAAELGVNSGLNNLGPCVMNGTHGVEKNLVRARELFRQSAECLHNEAMSNLAELHASLFDFETAARWADTAAKYGFLPSVEIAATYRARAEAKAVLTAEHRRKLVAAMAVLSSAEKPDLSRLNETPTLEELGAIGTPYGARLFTAKKLMCTAMKAAHDDGDWNLALNLVVAARGIDDCELVFSEEENRFSFALGSVLKEEGAEFDAHLALLTQPSDPSSAIAFWTSLQRQFPEDLAITKRAACMLMFEAYPGHDFQRGVQLFQRAFSLLPYPDNDADPQTLDLLYVAGVGYKNTDNFTRAEALLTRFLKHAPDDGHRKAAEATYLLGSIAMKTLEEIPEKIPDVIAKYLEEGDRLLQRIPPFLKSGAEKSSHRAVLQQVISLAGMDSVTPPLYATSNPGGRRGGELVDGPRRLEELRSATPSFQPKVRAEIAAMARIASQGSTPWSIQGAKTPMRAIRGATYSPATIDELFSAMEDRVCEKRVIKCIVVSLPSFNGSSFQFVVEDSQREPSRIALYNAHPSLIAQLMPGREFDLLNPYVRLAKDGSVMLRVDDPSATIKLKDVHVICWVCSVEQTEREQAKRCGKCRKAMYCSKECQMHDWRVNGHKLLCSDVANRI